MSRSVFLVFLMTRKRLAGSAANEDFYVRSTEQCLNFFSSELFNAFSNKSTVVIMRICIFA
jgi:hypothetical protein